MVNTRNLFKWFFALLVAITMYTIAPAGPDGLIPMYAALSSFAVVLWVFEIFPPFATATALVFSYVLVLGIDPEFVFLPWSTTLVWIGFGGIMLGDSMRKTGLARRIALKCILLTGGSFTGLAIGFMCAGIVVGFLLPALFARVVIFCAIAISIIDTIELDKKSRISSTLILMAFFAASAPCMMFLHTSESFIWAFEMMYKDPAMRPDFWTYVAHGSLFSLIYTIASFATLWLVKGKECLPPCGELRAAVSSRYAEMGPMLGKEKRLLIVVILAISAFMIAPAFDFVSGSIFSSDIRFTLDPVFLFAALALLCYLPALDIATTEDFGKLEITFLLMVTGCVSMGMVGTFVGANGWAVSQLKPILTSMSPTMAVIASYVGGLVVNFILTPLAATAAFVPAFAEIGTQMGINPLPLFYAFGYGIDQYVLPYEMVPFLYIFTTGYVKLRHVAGALGLRMLITGILIAAIAVPYWMFIGIL